MVAQPRHSLGQEIPELLLSLVGVLGPSLVAALSVGQEGYPSLSQEQNHPGAEVPRGCKEPSEAGDREAGHHLAAVESSSHDTVPPPELALVKC